MAWDCGAVTTGPVTVPVLLALGVGVMDAQRQKRAALAVLEDAALKKSVGELLATKDVLDPVTLALLRRDDIIMLTAAMCYDAV